MKIKVKNNRPTYSPYMGCYVVEYSEDGNNNFKTFDSYQEGTTWLKETFPIWFKKHYSNEKD